VTALETLVRALDDAAQYRREYEDGDCVGCEHGIELCGDHASDEQRAKAYDCLRAMLRDDRDQARRGDGLFGGLWAYFAPDGWATQWYWPDGVHGKVRNLLHGRGWHVR
jgi:hypothetical protein